MELDQLIFLMNTHRFTTCHYIFIYLMVPHRFKPSLNNHVKRLSAKFLVDGDPDKIIVTGHGRWVMES
ncbi:hypothetical protein LXL04_002537 [Taraxacum kok-saghyz]